jgi:hypothetical protein
MTIMSTLSCSAIRNSSLPTSFAVPTPVRVFRVLFARVAASSESCFEATS